MNGSPQVESPGNGPERRSTESRRPSYGLDLLAVAGVVLAVLVPLLWGTRGPINATVKMGPNTGAYLTGAAAEYEIEGLQATRWTSWDTTLALPLVLRGGPAEISYRFARVLPQTAIVDVLLNGRPIDRFTCRGGIFAVRHVRLAALGTTPLELRFKVDSHDHRGLGLKLDWVRIETERGGRMRLRGESLWLVPLLAGALLLLLRFMGHSLRMAVLLVAPLGLAAVVWAMHDPFAFAHVAARTAMVAGLLAAALAVALRRLPGGRWVMAIVVAGYLLKGAGLFHPTSFYPDFQHNRRYALAVAAGSGDLAERNRAAQTAICVAYPRIIAGKSYAFPYTPFAFLPFAVLFLPDVVEDALRQESLVAAALEPLLVFLLALLIERTRRRALGEPALPDAPRVVGVVAALLCAFLPSTFSRLLLAMGATLVGHLWDCGLIVAVLLYLLRPERRLRLAAVALFAALSLLTYISSLFTVSAFLVMVALLERKHALRLLLILAAAVAVPMLWLYAPFVREFVGEILPAVLHGARMAAAPGVPTGPKVAFDRVILFYGWAYPALAIAGLMLLRRRADPRAFNVVAAYGLAYLVLVALRAFGGGLFRDLKETTFVGPLVALLTGLFIEELARRGRPGRLAAALVVAGLLAFGLCKYREYLQTYSSPFLVIRGDTSSAASTDGAPAGHVPARSYIS
jgi:hypothetical protein